MIDDIQERSKQRLPTVASDPHMAQPTTIAAAEKSEIARWLTELGFSQYIEVFEGEDIDMDTLRKMNLEALHLLKVKVGHAFKILEAIAGKHSFPPALQKRLFFFCGPSMCLISLLLFLLFLVELNKAKDVPQQPEAAPQETEVLPPPQTPEVPEVSAVCVVSAVSEEIVNEIVKESTPLKRDAPERNKENHTPPCLDEEPARKRRRVEEPSDSGEKTAEKPALCTIQFLHVYLFVPLGL